MRNDHNFWRILNKQALNDKTIFIQNIKIPINIQNELASGDIAWLSSILIHDKNLWIPFDVNGFFFGLVVMKIGGRNRIRAHLPTKIHSNLNFNFVFWELIIFSAHSKPSWRISTVPFQIPSQKYFKHSSESSIYSKSLCWFIAISLFHQ